jgi:hypothetical protein
MIDSSKASKWVLKDLNSGKYLMTMSRASTTMTLENSKGKTFYGNRDFMEGVITTLRTLGIGSFAIEPHVRAKTTKKKQEV